jgi:hypothetical protein
VVSGNEKRQLVAQSATMKKILAGDDPEEVFKRLVQIFVGSAWHFSW